MYNSVLGPSSQQLMVLTNSLSKQDIQSKVNSKIYELIDTPKVESYSALFDHLEKESRGRILIECGLNVLHKYFREVETGRKNKIDLFMVNKFEGQLP